MSELRRGSAVDENIEARSAEQVDDWEIEEVVARFDRVSERHATRTGGSTGCH